MSDVATAVNGIPLKLTFKGAYFFALQPLAALCDPNSAQGATNGLVALHAGALERMTPALTKFAEDEQISSTILRIMEAMVIQMCAANDDHAVDSFVKSGAYEAVVEWIIINKKSDRDQSGEKCLRTALNIVNSLSSAKPDRIPGELTTKLAGVMLQGLTGNTTIETAKQLVDLTAGALSGAENAKTLVKSGGIKSILEYLTSSQIARCDPVVAVPFVIKSLEIAENVYQHTVADAEGMSYVMKLIDRYESVPAIHEKCVKLMQSTFTKDTLKRNMGVIADAGVTRDEKAQALRLLIPISYIPNLVSSCDREDITSLVQALRQITEPIDKVDNQALTGCCKMLGNAVKKPSIYQTVMDAGALQVCMHILSETSDPDIMNAVCFLLAPLVGTQQGAEQFLSDEKCFAHLLEIVSTRPSSSLASGFAYVLQNICQTRSCCDFIADTSAVEAIETILKDSKTSDETAEKLTNVFAGLTAGLEDLEPFDVDRFLNCANIICTTPQINILSNYSAALASLATNKTAKKYLDKDKICNAAFTVLSRVPINSKPYNFCSKVLEVFADAEIYGRIADRTRESLTGSSSDRTKTVGQLTVLSAMGKVDKLKASIQSGDIDQVLGKHLKKLAAQRNDNNLDRDAEAAACVQCLISLYPGQEGAVRSLRQLFETIKSDNVRQDQSKNAQSQLLTVCLSGVKSVIDLDNLKTADPGTMTEIAQETLSCLQIYGDNRKSQVLGTDIFGSIIGVGPAGVSAIQNSSSHLYIVQNARKFKMWADLQVASFKAFERLSNHFEQNPKICEQLRQANIMDAIRGAQVAHPRCEQLRVPLMTVAQKIMPEGYLDDAINEAIRDLRLAMQGKQWVSIQDSLITLLGLIDSPEGLRIAAKTMVIPLLTDLLLLSIGDSQISPTVGTDIARTLNSLTNGSSGCRAALKCGTVNAIDNVITKYHKLGATVVPDVDLICCLMNSMGNLVFKEPKEAKVLQKTAPLFADIGRKYLIDSTAAAKFDDAYANMLIAIPDDLRIKDPACEALLTSLIRDLDSDNFEKASKAAGKLRNFARHDATCHDFITKGINGKAYQALDRHANTGAVKSIISLLERLSGVPEPGMTDVVVKKRVDMLTMLILSSSDPELITPAMTVLSRLVQHHRNPELFENMDVLYDTIRHAQKITHREANTTVADSIGSILNVVGGEAGVVSWLNRLTQLATTDADSNDIELVTALSESNIYLRTHIKRAEKITEPFDRCVDQLGSLLTRLNTLAGFDTELLVSLCSFTDQAASACNRVHDAQGRQAMATSLMDHLIDPLSASISRALKTNPSGDVICSALDAYIALLNNPDTRLTALSAIDVDGIALHILQLKESDENLSSRARVAIAEFVKALARDTDGVTLLEKAHKSRKAEVTQLDWHFKALANLNTEANLPEMDATCSVITGLLRENPLVRGDFWKKPQHLTQLDLQCAGHAGLLARKIGIIAAALAGNVTVDSSRILERSVQELKDLFESGTLDQSQISMARNALLESLQQAGNSAEMQQALRRNRVFDLLADITNESVRNPGSWKLIIPALIDLADMSEQNAAGLAQSLIPIMIKDHLMFEKDHELKSLTARFLGSLCKYTGQGFNLQQVPDFLLLKESLFAGTEGLVRLELDELIKVIESDEPNVITLRKVLAIWLEELGSEGTNLLHEHLTASTTNAAPDSDKGVDTISKLPKMTPATSANVADYIGFVFNEMSSRARSPSAGGSSEASAEMIAGLECFRILHLFQENRVEIEEREEDEVIASGIMNQDDPRLLQEFVNTGLDLVLFCPRIAKAFSGVPGIAHSMLRCIKKCRESGIAYGSMEATQSFTADHDPSFCLANRLVFMSKIIPHRKWLENTDAVHVFMDCWNDVDCGKFDDRVLYSAMKCLRGSVTAADADYLLEQKLPQRILGMIQDKTTNPRGLSDAFFLVGVLGAYPVFKEAIGAVGVIEATLAFIDKHKHDPATSAYSGVVTNALLALGSICVEHKKNVDKFVDHKGIELSVSIIKQEGGSTITYDRINAAAVLLCNVTYKRDDVKGLYAKAQAPEAIMNAISGYDGRAAEEATRCMNSMFKAVGNLALYAPNVLHFVDNGIVDVFRAFLERAGEMHPSVHEAGVRCLSNLLMENDERTTAAFSALVPTLVDDVSNRLGHSEVEIFRHGLEALQYLSRSEENARIAIDRKIIPHCVAAAENTNSLVVLNAVTSFIASISRHASLVGDIVDQGAMNAIMTVLDKEKEVTTTSTELSQKSFIVLRRLFKDWDIAYKFTQQGQAAATAKMICQRAESPSAQIAGCKLLLYLLQSFPPPPAPVQDHVSDEWEEEVPGNEGFMPISHLIKRPHGPRSYQQLGLEPSVINELIMTLTQTMSAPNGSTLHKFLEVALLLQGYFAHEKIIGCEDAFFNANFFNVAAQVLMDNSGNVLYSDIIAGITANVACVANDAAFAVFKQNKEFANALKNSVKFIEKDYKVEKRYISNVAALALSDSATQLDFLPYAAFDFEFDRLTADDQTRANGVQDLPHDVREILRKGGEFYLITPENLKGERYAWKASLDLNRIQWGPSKDSRTLPNDSAILKCTSIRPGCATALLLEAKKAHKLSCSESNLAAVYGLLPDDALHLRFKSRSSRDQFCALLKEWRDAAANLA